MPSESTLRAWSSKIEIMPGFLSISFTQIKSYQKKSEKQLYCELQPTKHHDIIYSGTPTNQTSLDIIHSGTPTNQRKFKICY
ncbi:unnamed protein product [Gordionus sp. m RMFG-2023]